MTTTFEFKKFLILFSILFIPNLLWAQQPNIALHKKVSVSSETIFSPALNLVDGKISRSSRWEASNNKPPHWVEIDLAKYYTISTMKIHTGIIDSEKKSNEMTQAAGFWSIKNFKLQYWDDANWTDIPNTERHENRLTTIVFNFEPGISTYKIRLLCDDGEPVNIMEMEIFGLETPNMPEPPSIITAGSKYQTNLGKRQAVVNVKENIVGKSMKYVGYNQGYYYPGSNVSGWIEYSKVNSLRVWASLSTFSPASAVQLDSNVNSVTEFDKRKTELRANPENNPYIQWDKLYKIYNKAETSATNPMILTYVLSELKRLDIDVVLQVSSTDFEDNWTNKWKQWQRYYALAYYTAQNGNAAMFALQNEPNHRNSGPMKLDQWIMAMQIGSDAIHAAINDVNKKYNKTLEAKLVGPVTAGQNPDWWAAIAKAIRTDYHGKQVDKDLIGIFSTHSYNSPAIGYASRINNIRQIIQQNHPEGKALPIVYTEIGRWMNAYLIDKEETMDSPSLFTEWAGIYANNMKNGGYGMWAFKFANTTSDIFSRGVKSGHHFTWQGKRIVEDQYTNLALDKKVSSSNVISKTKWINDGDKSDASAWISDSTSNEKWLEIDLAEKTELGSATVYTGSGGGVYTAPDRIENFRLQYLADDSWKDIPGAVEKNNKYAQVFIQFKQSVSTQKVRFLSQDNGILKVREIKLFGKEVGPSAQLDYNISGIQRTGEVVRLFAKGFKNERPLLETNASENDTELDTYTAYDEKSGNYYMWLVQRGAFDYQLNIDLSKIDVSEGAPITAETVGPLHYGEVTGLISLSPNKQFTFNLLAQSVVLLTIPKRKLNSHSIIASADASVTGGKNIGKNEGSNKLLEVQLDASQPDKNKVAYLHFDYADTLNSAQKIILKLHGKNDRTDNPFRLHVYGIPSSKWNETELKWSNAPLLDSKEALIKEVGQKVFIAGEIAFDNKFSEHMLDVTDMVKKYAPAGVTFVLVRETRQLGDDEDKGKKASVSSRESDQKPTLIFFK